MAYLHENREEFTNAVNLASEYFQKKRGPGPIKWPHKERMNKI